MRLFIVTDTYLCDMDTFNKNSRNVINKKLEFTTNHNFDKIKRRKIKGQ